MPAKKNTAVETATVARSTTEVKKHRGKYMPLEEAKPLFLGLLEQHGRLSRNAAKPLMATLGFSERANWIALPQQLIDEGLIRKDLPNREDGEKYGQYTLTKKGEAAAAGLKPSKSKGKGSKRTAAATSSHKVGPTTTRQSCK